jgi:uncharacterized membrane protein YhaH (DUF805 family)
MQIREFLQWNGKVSRWHYFLVGVIGFAIKHNLDRFIGSRFHVRWTVWSYWIPLGQLTSPLDLSGQQKELVATLFLTALPFIWVGFALTVKRLRDAGLPTWLSILFFAPIVNLLFFAVLCVAPNSAERVDSEQMQRPRGGYWPAGRAGSAALAVIIGGLGGAIFTWADMRLLGTYGFSLFLMLPFAMGYIAVWVVTRRRFATITDALVLSAAVIAFAGMMIAVFAIEGLVCLAMVAPIAWVMALFGALVARVIHNRYLRPAEATPILVVVLLSAPILMGAEYLEPPPVPRFQVHTVIEIAAPPELVWAHLIQFPELPKPTEWTFRFAGVAYPIEARLSGAGLSADRECRFSTGSFKEPILVWEPGRHFAFSVASEPPLMTETSPYGQIHVRHLDDHDFQPERADFVLVALPHGGTRLEGTTTYINKMWPGSYWRFWTDGVVHSIHNRVFQHVKRLAEADAKVKP